MKTPLINFFEENPEKWVSKSQIKQKLPAIVSAPSFDEEFMKLRLTLLRKINYKEALV